jgi:hypothetical protein
MKITLTEQETKDFLMATLRRKYEAVCPTGETVDVQVRSYETIIEFKPKEKDGDAE